MKTNKERLLQLKCDLTAKDLDYLRKFNLMYALNNKGELRKSIFEIYKSYSNKENESLWLIFIYSILDKNNKNLLNAIQDIINNKRLYKNNKKRVSWIEIKYKILSDIRYKYNLSDYQVDIILFSIKLGLNYPGIVGTPLNEYQINDKFDYENAGKIIDTQNKTKFGSINSDYMISQMKGGLSVDLGFGCPLGCIYCYRIDDSAECYINKWKPDYIINELEAVKRLINHPWFTPHVTPIGIHMSTTEAFLPSVWPSTYNILKLLDDIRLTNRVTIITKYILNNEQLEMLNSFEYIDLDICVCYSGLPKEIEPSSSKIRIDFLERICKYINITPIAYFRPLIEGYNTTDAKILEVLQLFKNTGVSTIVYGGVKISEKHKKNFKLNNINIPEYSGKDGHKFLSNNFDITIRSIFNKVYKDSEVQLYKHSSCGRVSGRSKYIPDYNCHNIYKSSDCTSCNRKEICNQKVFIQDNEIQCVLQRLLKGDIKYSLENNILFLDTELNRYEKIFINQNLYIDTKFRTW